jgi:hypothetical protein
VLSIINAVFVQFYVTGISALYLVPNGIGECEKKLFWTLKMAAAYGCMPTILQYCVPISFPYSKTKKHLLRTSTLSLFKIVAFSVVFVVG